jgi:hypothetical protein
MNATTRKPARETHGTCRLLYPESLDTGDALLVIYPERGQPTSYTVLRLADKNGPTLGFRLTRLADYLVDRKVYDVDISQPWGWTCDCPDAQFRSRECKHVRALRCALKAAGVSATQKPEPQPQPAPSAPEPAEEEETVELTEEPPQPAKVCFECGQSSEDFYCDRCNSL